METVTIKFQAVGFNGAEVYKAVEECDGQTAETMFLTWSSAKRHCDIRRQYFATLDIPGAIWIEKSSINI